MEIWRLEKPAKKFLMTIFQKKINSFLTGILIILFMTWMPIKACMLLNTRSILLLANVMLIAIASY